MPEPLYFQWQNELLLKTIYPLREMKLRDFLVYYREIELWAEYKNKNIVSEIGAYHAQKRLAVQKAIQNYYADRQLCPATSPKGRCRSILSRACWIGIGYFSSRQVLKRS
jgi:hypothetical protein